MVVVLEVVVVVAEMELRLVKSLVVVLVEFLGVELSSLWLVQL